MKLLSMRARAELWKLQAATLHYAEERNQVARMLLNSRNVITPAAQLELWFEFVCMDQEYRYAVVQLADFCSKHGQTRPGEKVK